MVAPSFQQFEQLGEPYLVSGKMYVMVRNPKTGTERQVRWYSTTEYNKLYPSHRVPEETQELTTQRKALGFEKGYIFLYKGDIEANEEWFRREIKCRYCKYWGWYTISTVDLPADIPEGIAPIQLRWEEVGKPSGALLPEDKVVNAVERLLYEQNSSEWVGTIGERLELELTVLSNYAKDTNYGVNHTHILEDQQGNRYGWSTTARNWSVGEIKKIRGTIKSHETYKNIRITWLTRCMEVK